VTVRRCSSTTFVPGTSWCQRQENLAEWVCTTVLRQADLDFAAAHSVSLDPSNPLQNKSRRGVLA